MLLPRTPPRGRRGMGVLLVVILSFVVVLTIVGFAQRYLNSAVSGSTQRTSIGDLALDLAESQVEEMVQQFRVQANEPGSPLFAKLRQDVYANDLGNFDATHALVTPAFDKLLKSDPLYAKFYSRETKAEVVYQRQFEDLPYERFGLLRVHARVQFDVSLTESVAREVEVGVGFKTALVAPPRPFDQPAFLVFASDNTQSLEFADLNAKKREYTALVTETLASAAQRVGDPSTPDPVRPDYRDVAGAVQSADLWQTKLPDLPSERVAMFSTKPPNEQLSFDDLFILKKVLDREKAELDPAKRAVQSAYLAVGGAPDSLDLQRALAAAYKKQASVLQALLKMMEDQRALFELWDGEKYDQLDRFRYKLDRARYAQKAFYTLAEADADAQLRRMAGAWKPLNGVVRVDNDHRVLDLTNVDIAGKLVVVCGAGGVHLSSTNRAERPNDLLTVISIGGPVTLDGDVHAFVIGSQHASFTIAPGTVVHGGFVTDQVPGATDRQFKIVHEGKYFSGLTSGAAATGAFADYYYVGTSPRFTYKKVTRK